MTSPLPPKSPCSLPSSSIDEQVEELDPHGRPKLKANRSTGASWVAPKVSKLFLEAQEWVVPTDISISVAPR